MGDVVGRYLSDAPEHDDIHKHREEWRNEIPTHAEDGLLELDRYIALDKQPDEVALAPQFTKPQALRKRIRRYLRCPICRSYCFNVLMF